VDTYLSGYAHLVTDRAEIDEEIVFLFEPNRETRPELRPLYNTCVDTNGPSTRVFMDDQGLLNERLPGDPVYWDATDLRPWGTWLDESDKRYEEYRRTEGARR